MLGEPIGFTGAADRDVIAAARLAVDPSLPIGDTSAIDVWLQRWARIGLIAESGRVAVGQRANLLARAATSARLTRRAGAVDFTPNGSALAIAEQLDLAESATHSPATRPRTSMPPAQARCGRSSTYPTWRTLRISQDSSGGRWEPSARESLSFRSTGSLSWPERTLAG